MEVCVYSERVSQEGFGSEAYRSSGFEGDHPSTVSVAQDSTQYVCVCPPVFTCPRVVFLPPLDIKGEFFATFFARRRWSVCVLKDGRHTRRDGSPIHPIKRARRV